ncbi:hypothetical protein XELAEV_18004836mg [Xenopus laevis]|uniref:Uncharacterized protein n=1 Tax=Xenopus laevis TaxID=8355 RepID=A0A974DXZ9_XENLA|nr:hypothetical protein XELAEV_18004836mg [Xenopus laevis]
MAKLLCCSPITARNGNDTGQHGSHQHLSWLRQGCWCLGVKFPFKVEFHLHLSKMDLFQSVAHLHFLSVSIFKLLAFLFLPACRCYFSLFARVIFIVILAILFLGMKCP